MIAIVQRTLDGRARDLHLRTATRATIPTLERLNPPDVRRPDNLRPLVTTVNGCDQLHWIFIGLLVDPAELAHLIEPIASFSRAVESRALTSCARWGRHFPSKDCAELLVPIRGREGLHYHESRSAA